METLIVLEEEVIFYLTFNFETTTLNVKWNEIKTNTELLNHLNEILNILLLNRQILLKIKASK